MSNKNYCILQVSYQKIIVFTMIKILRFDKIPVNFVQTPNIWIQQKSVDEINYLFNLK